MAFGFIRLPRITIHNACASGRWKRQRTAGWNWVHIMKLSALFFFKIISHFESLFPPLPPPLPPPGSPASEHPNPYAAQAERIDGEGNEPADAPLPEPPASVMPTICPEPAALEAPWETKSTDGPAGDTAMPQTAPSSAPGAQLLLPSSKSKPAQAAPSSTPKAQPSALPSPGLTPSSH